jgi:hypothetical protein
MDPAPPITCPVLPQRHRDHSEIDVWCQPPIEAHLRLASSAPSAQRREIEEPEIHGTLDLEDLRLIQEYPRDMGLDQLEAGRLEVCFEVAHIIARCSLSIPTRGIAPTLPAHELALVT